MKCLACAVRRPDADAASWPQMHRPGRTFHLIAPALLGICSLAGLAAMDGDEAGAARIQARQAHQLLRQAQDYRELGEGEAAMAVYEKIIERFPGTAAEFSAQLGLARHLVGSGASDQAFDRYARAAQRGVGIRAEPNPDAAERAEAFYGMGLCLVRQGEADRSFGHFRAVIEAAPGSIWANLAYFQIGEAHLAAGNFTQAIASLRMVGTSLSAEEAASSLLDLGRPLCIRVEDLDLLVLDGAPLPVRVVTDRGDEEVVTLRPEMPDSPVYGGQIGTALGVPKVGDGVVQADGTTRVSVRYRDQHNADGGLDRERAQELRPVVDGRILITDGAHRDRLTQVLLDAGSGQLDLLVEDGDRDAGNGAERVQVEVVAERPLPAEDDVVDPAPRWEVRSRLEVVLGEMPSDDGPPGAGVVHRSGRFTGTVPLADAEGAVPDGALAVARGDRITARYRDEFHLGSGPALRSAEVQVVPGTLASLAMAGTDLSDPNLKVRKELLQAETALRLGEVYRDMGLDEHAQLRFADALAELRRVGASAGAIDRDLEEQTLRILWRVHLARGRLAEAAEASRTLQSRFPDSDYIDDSLLALGEAAERAGDAASAVGLYRQVAHLPQGSPLAAEALFRIGRLHERRIQRLQGDTLVEDARERQQAITAYRAVFSGFPGSAFAAEALKKIGDFYFQERNFAQAIDFFERVLREHPDAPFLDEVLYNLARSRYLKEDFAGSLRAVERLEHDYPGFERMSQARKIRQLAGQRRSTGESLP